jgi:hypothetical protein
VAIRDLEVAPEIADLLIHAFHLMDDLIGMEEYVLH